MREKLLRFLAFALLIGPLAGYATFYDDSLDGDLMANGQPYDMTDPTIAAAVAFPLGAHLRVTRVATGESILVTVTDRGNFKAPLLVDLSGAAFQRLADPSDGRIRVVVEPVD